MTSLKLPCAVPYERQYCRTLGDTYDHDPYSCTHVGTIWSGPSGRVWQSKPWSSHQSQTRSPADEFIQQFEALADESELDEVMLTHLFECGLHRSVTEKIYGVEVMPKTLKGWKEYASRFDNQYRRFRALTKDTPSPRYPPSRLSNGLPVWISKNIPTPKTAY